MPRLLVVDGEDSICFSLKEYFTMQNYEVDTARDRDEAESRLETSTYDVVIQDLTLGPSQKLDGLEMVKFINNRDPRIRIVVLTAYGSPEIEKESLRCGAHAFLRKPKPLSHVAQVIQGLLESKSSHAQGA